jgi:hypothetical protein
MIWFLTLALLAPSFSPLTFQQIILQFLLVIDNCDLYLMPVFQWRMINCGHEEAKAGLDLAQP